jgi:hypothetical protein
MIRRMCARALVAAAVLTAAAPLHAEVRLTMTNGKVTLRATNATVRDILAEWAKVGRARVINGERVAGAPVTIELTDVPEGQALDVILRSVAGYMAAPRPTAESNVSIFDRILILPTSTAPRVTTAATPTPAPPVFTPPQPPFNPQTNDDDNDALRNGIPLPRPPVFNTFPPALQQALPNGQLPVPTGRPATAAPGQQMPVGVAVPGMIVQPPTQQPGLNPQ